MYTAREATIQDQVPLSNIFAPAKPSCQTIQTILPPSHIYLCTRTTVIVIVVPNRSLFVKSTEPWALQCAGKTADWVCADTHGPRRLALGLCGTFPNTPLDPYCMIRQGRVIN